MDYRGLISFTFSLLMTGSGAKLATAQPPCADRYFSGSSDGGLVLRLADCELRQTALSAFHLHYVKRGRKLATLATGFFDLYRNGRTPVIEVLLSNHAYRWSVTRQSLPLQPHVLRDDVIRISGTVPENGLRSTSPGIYIVPNVHFTSGTPVLQGFRLSLVGGSRRIEEIGVEFVPCADVRSLLGDSADDCGSSFDWVLRTTLKQRVFLYTRSLSVTLPHRFEVQATFVDDRFVTNRVETVLPRSRGGSPVWVGNHVPRNPAIQGFRLKFQNGNHKIRTLGVSVGSHWLTTVFSGSDAHPYDGVVRWIDVSDP